MANGASGPGAVYPSPYMPLAPPTTDPAWQPPVDKVADPKTAQARASVINREIPQTTTQGHWSWPEVRAALDDVKIGIFDRPSQLTEALMWDPRVQAALGSRTGGLLGRPAKFEPATNSRVKGSRAAKECFDAWQDAWPTIANEAAFTNLHAWGVMLHAPAQLLWDTAKPVWVPHVVPFHPRYTFYQFVFRSLIAITLDGLTPITPGDGHWVLHAPFGDHRGWMRGAMPAISQPWVQRNFAYRDVARFCERHGYPIAKLMVPAAADAKQIVPLRNAIANLGQESVLELPQGVDGQTSYDMEYLEATDSTWEVFPESIRLCDADITLALLGQNLTTEVKEGSFAAARIHGDVRQAFIEFDNRAMTQTIYSQIARPFASINFGDPDLAPWTSRDVQPYEDNQMAASTFAQFAQACSALRLAGIAITDPEALAWTMGIKLAAGKTRLISPTTVEAANVFAGAAEGGGEATTDKPTEPAKKDGDE